METATASVGTLTFDVQTWGPSDGIPLLSLHGFPQHGRSWSKVAQLLAEAGIRTIAFDQRGYSPGARAPLSDYTLDKVVDDALGVAEAMGLSSFHLAGFGQGALQSWTIAARHPDRVSSVTALRFPHPAVFADSVRTDPEQRAAWDALEEMSPPQDAAEKLLRDGGAELRRFLASSGMRPELLEDTLARLEDRDVLEAAVAWHLIPIEAMAAVPSVTVPALYVFSRGPALLPATALRCHEAVDGPYELVELTDVGHWLLDTASDSLATVIAAHVSRNSPEPDSGE